MPTVKDYQINQLLCESAEIQIYCGYDNYEQQRFLLKALKGFSVVDSNLLKREIEMSQKLRNVQGIAN
ncbi:MAG: hypothetical protein ACOCRO_10200, partial [Halanaerobiales bacterium]